MKNAVFWDIKPSSYLTGHTLHIHYRGQPIIYVRFEAIREETVKNAIFLDVMRCGSFKN
jgi:hypothetical protein